MSVVSMNRKYNYKVSSKNSKRLLKNLQIRQGGLLFCCTPYILKEFYRLNRRMSG